MTNFTKKLLPIFIFNAVIVSVLSADCSTNYILPIFSNDFGCISDGFFGHDWQSDCYGLVRSVLSSCRVETTRDLITIFDFYFGTTYTCPTGSNDKLCMTNQTNDMCPEMLTNLKFNESNFLETKIINYDSESDLSAQIGDLCAFKLKTYGEPQDHSKRDSWPKAATAGIIIASVVLGLIILWILFWMQRVYNRYQISKIEEFADNHAKSAKHILFGKYKDEWEVTPKELKVEQDKVLGQGAFGKVYLGHLKKQRNKEYIQMDVAVKFTHDHSDERTRKEMIEEIGFMKALGSHENLLVMVGYVKSIENPVICTVFCSNGDLLGILRQHKIHFMSTTKCQDAKICLLLPDLLRLSIEVCNGLEYLASNSYVHRDIAARNILITDQMVAKLADFGLCKKLELHDICIIDKHGKFPIKHMCYESLKFGEFSTKTDVWSFGVLMFEMFSGGESPFKEIPLEEFVKYLENDGKPIFPQETPQPLVKFLNEKIFQKYPSRRANFKEIKKELEKFYAVVLSVVKSG